MPGILEETPDDYKYIPIISLVTICVVIANLLLTVAMGFPSDFPYKFRQVLKSGKLQAIFVQGA